MDIVEARPDQWGELFTLQRAAFVDEAVLYGTPDVPALTETAGEFQARLGASITLVALASDRIVGAVSAIVRERAPEIERLMVAPDYRRRGVATALMTQIERRLTADGHESAQLIVGDLAPTNRRLYERLGYEAVERSIIFENVAICIMAKTLR